MITYRYVKRVQDNDNLTRESGVSQIMVIMTDVVYSTRTSPVIIIIKVRNLMCHYNNLPRLVINLAFVILMVNGLVN